jgi:hypothetical protein
MLRLRQARIAQAYAHGRAKRWHMGNGACAATFGHEIFLS